MSHAQELPTEILYSIFELSACRVLPPSWSSPFTSTAEFCALPSLKEISIHCITLSHVCVRWRDVAIGLECLWEQIYLSGNAFNPIDDDFLSITRDFLSRSSIRALCLDIMIGDPSFSTSSTLTQVSEIVSNALYTHVGRCHTLRLFGSDQVLTAILDVFMEYNLSSSPLLPSSTHSPLSHLHIVQTAQTKFHSTVPLDLALVAPQLTFLRVERANISTFPRWHLHSVALTDTFLSYHNHFHLFQKSASRRLLLNNILIPGGIPYVRRLLEHHWSPITSLTLSHPRCARVNEDKIGEDEQKNIYTMFFTLTLFPTLRELELAHLEAVALTGFLAMLCANPPVTFIDLRTLKLRSVDITIKRGNVNLGIALVRAFPGVCEVVFEDVVGGDAVVGLWKTSSVIQFGSQVWMGLEEMLVDGCVVRRMR